MAGGVECFADHADLAVHHPARPDDMDAGIGLGNGHRAHSARGRVVVDRPVGRQYAAMAMVGELVEAEVAHHDEFVPDLADHIGESRD